MYEFRNALSLADTRAGCGGSRSSADVFWLSGPGRLSIQLRHWASGASSRDRVLCRGDFERRILIEPARSCVTRQNKIGQGCPGVRRPAPILLSYFDTYPLLQLVEQPIDSSKG